MKKDIPFSRSPIAETDTTLVGGFFNAVGDLLIYNLNIMKPSNFTSHPCSSILKKDECETVARNIMIILKRTGNEFRELSFEEYTSERLKDGNFTSSEESHFKKVIEYCTSAEQANRFCSNWAS